MLTHDRPVGVALLARAVSMFALALSASTTLAVCPPSWLNGGAGANGPTGAVDQVRAFASWTPPGSTTPLLVVGGEFNTIAGVQAHGIATWDGAHWAPLGGSVAGRVDSLVVSNGKLYVGGLFSSAGSVPVHNIAMWDGNAWHALGMGADGFGMGPLGEIYAMAADAFGQIWVGGWFSSVSNWQMHNLAIWSPVAGLWSTTLNGMNFEVDSLALYNGHIVAGGSFTNANGVTASHVAYFVNNDGWHAMGPGLSGDVLSLCVTPTGVLMAGGSFLATGDGLTGLAHVASWDGAKWSPVGSGLSNTVRAITFYQGLPVAIGDFATNQSGTTPSHISQWNGSSWTLMGAGLSDTGRALYQFGGELFAGGSFFQAGNNYSARIATWSANTPWIAQQPKPLTLAPGANATVSANVAVGYPGLSYRWRRNNVLVSNGAAGAAPGGGFVSGATGAVPATGAVALSIQNAQAADAGSYTVELLGGCVNPTSSAAQLTVSAMGAADVNGDGHINSFDLALMLSHYGQLVTPGSAGDTNDDGIINTADLALLLSHFGQ